MTRANRERTGAEAAPSRSAFRTNSQQLSMTKYMDRWNEQGEQGAYGRRCGTVTQQQRDKLTARGDGIIIGYIE